VISSAVLAWLLATALAGAVGDPVARGDLSEASAVMTDSARLQARELVVGGALPDEPLPLVVVLHGRAGRADRFVRRFAGLGVPARVIALEAPLRAKGTGFAWLSRPACHAPRDQVAAELSRAAVAVARELRVLREQRPTTGAPVLVGYSQGAMVALAVAVHEPSAVGQVIAAAGYLPSELAPGRSSGQWRPRVRMVHGQTDAAWFRTGAHRLPWPTCARPVGTPSSTRSVAGTTSTGQAGIRCSWSCGTRWLVRRRQLL